MKKSELNKKENAVVKIRFSSRKIGTTVKRETCKFWRDNMDSERREKRKGRKENEREEKE